VSRTNFSYDPLDRAGEAVTGPANLGAEDRLAAVHRPGAAFSRNSGENPLHSTAIVPPFPVKDPAVRKAEAHPKPCRYAEWHTANL
jgi:hypothetical protein